MSACSAAGPVAVDIPPATSADRTRCAQLAETLPARVNGLRSRRVEPSSPRAAAWGDPPVVLRCGVARPAGLTRASACFEVNGVGWHARRTDDAVVFTTIGRTAYVEVAVPRRHAPEAGVLVDLAAPIERTLPLRQPCV